MKDTIAWIAKNLILPLLPAITGALIRYAHSGHFNEDTFEIGELSFSMAMLFVIVMNSASRLNDKGLREALTVLFTIGLVIFLVLFVCTTLLKTQVDSTMRDNIAQINKLLSNSQIESTTVARILNDQHLANTFQMLARIRFFAMWSAATALPLTVIIKLKYKLED